MQGQENPCPSCHSALTWDGQYYCSSCSKHYRKVAFCPDCSALLEKLQACGSASYFCHSCNELKSKSRVKIEFQLLGLS
ncbi:zinc ribbon domain-containing protein [Vibrio sp. ZSDZ65]|uniref:Zinc ribbon domain-containing protein n=1 Tax=Vibrio qingdaonensis TaxID=2829491 RepID=A0A9X3CQ49_9VIBR|nr:zinc ribbon domain-containing protein [Vibrio qingdaonensis]MCW8347538.1 zinc ribbon domain-containing protein [Vibrio qingdaonensis]